MEDAANLLVGWRENDFAHRCFGWRQCNLHYPTPYGLGGGQVAQTRRSYRVYSRKRGRIEREFAVKSGHHPTRSGSKTDGGERHGLFGMTVEHPSGHHLRRNGQNCD